MKDNIDIENPMKHIPKVSIGMPVYDGEELLQEALDSLLAQTFTDFELIISDNASTDGTEDICRTYAEKDTRIRYVRQSENRGGEFNFHFVLNEAKGEYFMWAAHDDVRDPSFIDCLVRALDTHPQAVLAFTGFDNIDDQGKQVRIFDEKWSEIMTSSKFRQYWAMTLFDGSRTQKANAIYGLMRCDVLRSCGGMMFLPGISFCGEDVWALLRLLALGDFVIIDRVLFHYRVREHLIRPDNQPIGHYLIQRAFKQVPGHRGSLILYLTRNYACHREMRRIVMRNAPLSLTEKIVLWVLILVKEYWGPLKAIPQAACHESGFMQK